MSIYAISDLHLTQDESKSMEKFGWIDHERRIFADWKKKVCEDDLVLIPGDISWAMDMQDAYADLDKIKIMKGKKVLLKGNHDYWWGSVTRLNEYDSDMYFMQNTIYEYEDYVICGSRGWLCPNDKKFTEHDEKIYKREVLRVASSLKLAKKTGKQIILIMHYPPTNDKKESSDFTCLADEFEVKTVIYGHLHDKENHELSFLGKVGQTEYHLVSCDYLNFELKKIV